MSDPAPNPIGPLPCSRRLGALFIISAPSGTGKSTLYRALRATPDFHYSVSCTTRAPRPGEVDGRDYHFIDEAEFERRAARGEFLEHARVHGNSYGTLRATINADLLAGMDLLLDLDIQGVVQIRNSPDPLVRAALVDVFLLPPSREVLEERLRRRGTETPEQIEVRLQNAVHEMENWKHYRYTIVSGSAEDDLRNFRAIMVAERWSSQRLRMDETVEKMRLVHG